MGGAEAPANLDIDVIFLAGTARLAEDLDGDGELELAANLNTDVILTSGTLHQAVDLDANGGLDLVIEPEPGTNRFGAFQRP